jgi:anti-anti-sigma factor
MPAATMTVAGDELRVALAGELDVATSRLVGLLGNVVPTAGRSRVTIDLNRVTFIDRRGIRAIARLVARYASAGIRTRCVPPGRRCPAIISATLVDAVAARGARIASPRRASG